jgi:fumarate reductase flavoprotein subunit
MIHTVMGPPMADDPFLRVNANGERFGNEDMPMPYTCNAAQLQPGNIVWYVFDSSYPEDAPKMGRGFSRMSVIDDAALERIQGAIDSGSLLEAGTIEELAQKMEVPGEALKATVERYNELVSMGKDLDFGKIPERLTAIDEPPFYAGKIPVLLLVTLGGLNVNPELQVLDKDRKVIPGLYAAGNVSGNFYANDYPVICPGLSHSRAWTQGYIAGKNAAA